MTIKLSTFARNASAMIVGVSSLICTGYAFAAGGILSSEGDFSNGQEDFQSFTSNGSAQFNNGEANFQIHSVSSSEPWRVQLSHALSIQSGRQYTICFEAKASGTRSIRYVIDAGPSTYTPFSGSSDSASLTTQYQLFSKTFTASHSDSTARLAIDMANSSRSVQLDNIGVYEGNSCPTNNDEDGDGVIDSLDQCPNTPTGAQVDSRGCELDDDNDGVVNRLDQCPNTPSGTFVDNTGCEITGDTFRVEAENYSRASDADSGNNGTSSQCQYLGQNVDVQNTSDTGGGCNVGWTQSGEWLEYELSVPAGNYAITSRVASNTNSGRYEIRIDGSSIGTDSVANTGGWQAWRNSEIGDVTLTAGEHTLRVNITGSEFNLNWIELTSTGPDEDGDGIPDDRDLCPNTPAGSPVDNNGCERDEDNDGIVDRLDQCPNTPAGEPVDSVGCEFDEDGDGVPNGSDQCANTPPGTLVDESGCEWIIDSLRLEAEAYDNASDSDSGNNGNPSQCSYRGQNVDVENTSDSGSGCNVGWTANGEWLEYQFELPGGRYALSSRYASNTSGSAYRVSLDGSNVANHNVSNTAGWQNWRTADLGEINLSSGSHTIRVSVTAAGFNLNWLELNLMIADEDGDGVADADDLCPGTPTGRSVDAQGCMNDEDEDGVIDNLDQCANTPQGATVDSIGCPSDSDGDGVLDGIDLCPNTDPEEEVTEQGCPVNGMETVQTLLVMIDFSDAPADIPMDEVNRMMNTPGHTGDDYLINVRDYWFEVSRQKINMHTHIFGYYRAPHTAAHYRSQSWTVGRELVAEAFRWVRDNNPDFDWDQLSLETDGTFLGLQAAFTTRIPSSGATHFLGGSRFTAPNGVAAGQMTAQTLWDWNHDNHDLFVFMHEQGHMLWGWPDLYNVNGGAGTGRYDLMSSNNHWIGVPNAALLAEEGWVDVINIDGPQSFTLTENGNTVLRYQNPNVPQEYYIIEARNNTPLSAQRIPGADRGLYIWHVDERVSGNRGINPDLGQHYRISLEQADGRFDLENGNNSADDGDAFAPGDRFNDDGQPSARWWDGQRSGLDIHNIRFHDDGRISLDIGN